MISAEGLESQGSRSKGMTEEIPAVMGALVAKSAQSHQAVQSIDPTISCFFVPSKHLLKILVVFSLSTGQDSKVVNRGRLV
jgi:hypothetical protein